MRRSTRDFIGMCLASCVLGSVYGTLVYLFLPIQLWVPVGIPTIVLVGFAAGKWYEGRWE